MKRGPAEGRKLGAQKRYNLLVRFTLGRPVFFAFKANARRSANLPRNSHRRSRCRRARTGSNTVPGVASAPVPGAAGRAGSDRIRPQEFPAPAGQCLVAIAEINGQVFVVGSNMRYYVPAAPPSGRVYFDANTRMPENPMCVRDSG